MPEATVDILMPVYNCADYLSEAIESILAQDYPIEKIIILDDFSNDSTLKLARTYANKEPRILLLESDANYGIVHQLNRGLSYSHAKYVARMDGDDISYSDRISSQIDFLESHPEYVACSGSYHKISKTSSLIQTMSARNRKEDLKAIPAKIHYLIHPFLMVRANVIRQIKYREIYFCEDLDLYYRLRKYGMLCNISTFLGEYRIHPESLTSRSVSHNMLQSLNSQILSLYNARRPREQYPEYLNQHIYDLLLPKQLSISTILKNVADITNLTAEERTWLSLSFPIKSLQNFKLRELYLSCEDCEQITSSLAKYSHSPAPLLKKVSVLSKFYEYNKELNLEIYNHSFNLLPHKLALLLSKIDKIIRSMWRALALR